MSRRQAALLALLAALWGSSYLLIKYALVDFSPAEVVFLRAGIALAALLPVLAIQRAHARGVGAELRRRPGPALLLGLLGVAVPFLLIGFGELAVPSGLTAILLAPAPLFVAMLAPLLDASERIARRQAAGLVVGAAGVALLVGVESLGSLGQLLGALAIVAASASYALAGFVVKGPYRGVSPLVTGVLSMAAATVITLAPALATAPHVLPGLRAVAAVLVLGVVNTAVAFLIFYRLIGEIGAGRAALVTYLAPGFALFYGALLLGEAITVAGLVGFGLILAGVALASRRPRSIAPAPPVPPAPGHPALSAPCTAAPHAAALSRAGSGARPHAAAPARPSGPAPRR